jgi:hypothetical protein
MRCVALAASHRVLKPEVRRAACWAINHVASKPPGNLDVLSKLQAVAQNDVHMPTCQQALKAITSLIRSGIARDDSKSSIGVLLGCLAAGSRTTNVR